MCLLSVKEEPGYVGPRRVSNFRGERAYSSPSPQVARVSKTRIVEERRPSRYALPSPEPPAPASIPPPAPAVYNALPPDPQAPPPPPNAHYSATKIETRQTQTRRTSQPPIATYSASSNTYSHYVEVEHDTSSSSSSSSDSSEDVRSRSTHKSANTRKSSHSKTTAPASEYSIHEKEYVRDRRWSNPRGQYQTNWNAPASFSRSRSQRGDYDDPRASQASQRHERERYMIGDDYARR